MKDHLLCSLIQCCCQSLDHLHWSNSEHKSEQRKLSMKEKGGIKGIRNDQTYHNRAAAVVVVVDDDLLCWFCFDDRQE